MKTQSHSISSITRFRKSRIKYFRIITVIIIFFVFYVNQVNAQWVKTNGPSGIGGVVNSIALDSSYIFAISNGCIYRSSDKGNSWLLVYSSNKSNFSITSLALNSSYIYAGTLEPAGGYGIFQSSDLGDNWLPNKTEISSTSPTTIYSLGVHDSVILAGSQFGSGAAGMYRSIDYGNNWTRVRPSGITCFAFQDSLVFASVANQTTDPYGVYLSKDLGATWSITNFPNISAYSVAANGNIVLAGSDSGIYRSTDNGVTWKIVDSSFKKVNVIIFNASGSYAYAGTRNGLFRSTDHGETWSVLNNGLKSDIIHSLIVYPVGSKDSNFVFAGTGSGLFRSTDNGLTWESAGIPNRLLPPSMFLASNGSVLFEGTPYNKELNWPGTNYTASIFRPVTVVFNSSDNGSNWAVDASGLDTVTYANLKGLVVSGANIYAGMTNAGVFLSTDNGTNWTSSGMNNMNVSAMAVIGSDIFAGTSDRGIYHASGNSSSWLKVNSGLTDSAVQALATSGSNLFAGTYSRKSFVANRNTIFLSTDKGTSWSSIDSELISNTSPPITCLRANGDNLIVGTGRRNLDQMSHIYLVNVGSVYRLTFDGSKWNRSDSALNGEYVTSLISIGANIFAGTYSDGIFASPDNGVTWNNISDGLTDSSVVSLVIHNSYLFAATSSGVYERPLSEITSVSPDNKTIPQNFSLEQNYPNPFNPSTTIEFSILKQSFVSLKVYDILGREIMTLVNEEKNPGRYKVEFKGKELSSGVYFYKLNADNFMSTKKFILMK